MSYDFHCPQCNRIVRCEGFFDHMFHMIFYCLKRKGSGGPT